MTIRLAIDIGGTFTDLVLDRDGAQASRKLLTTPARPADGIMQGVAEILGETGTEAGEVDLILHGTTLATNALIVTEGHRDSVEMAYENRFDQYDINADRLRPLVPRDLRLPVCVGRADRLPGGANDAQHQAGHDENGQ